MSSIIASQDLSWKEESLFRALQYLQILSFMYSPGMTLTPNFPTGAASRDRNSPPAAYDGWGRLENKKQSQNTRMSTMISNAPVRKGSSLGSSSEDTSDSHGIPMGNISKTTHVDVQYGNDRMENPMTTPKSKEHARSISATHLVGEDFSFP